MPTVEKTHTTDRTTALSSKNTAARGVNAILGAWLFLSAFIWAHSSSQFTNTWIVGALIAIVALVGIKYPQARFANTALSVWLLISAFALPTLSSATTWNNALVAIAVFAVSLVGSYRTIRARRPIRA